MATAPISWGVCEVPGWGHQLSPERVLSEMHSLGFTKTELGSAGWLPSAPDELTELLAANELSLLAAFIPLVLHDPAQREQALQQAAEAADLLATAGAVYFNTAPVTSAGWEPRRDYSEAEWSHLYEMLGLIDDMCEAKGLTQVVHEHYGCVVETAEEIRRVLDNTNTSLVLDTGHFAVGGEDSLEIIAKYPDRIGLVHLKDTKLEVAEQLVNGELSLMEAVQAGLFPSLGKGDLPLADIVRQLEKTGFAGWYVIEQDCAIAGIIPPPSEGPVNDVADSVTFLRALEV